jgi:hypothetical protein
MASYRGKIVMKTLRIALAAGLALLLAGCYPVTTKHSAGTTVGLGRDAALIGAWKARPTKDDQDDQPACLGIFKSERKLIGEFKPCAPTGDKKDVMRFVLTTAVLGERRILNATMTEMDGEMLTGEKAAAPFPLLYRIEGGTLSLFKLSDEKISAAADKGLIEANKNDNGDWVITAPPEKLDAFLADPANESYFEPLMVLDRMK